MNNPLNNQVTDSRDLLEYRDFLANELTDKWNALEHEDQTGETDFYASDVNEILGTDGYEYADNAKDFYNEFEEIFYDEMQHYNNINEFCEDLMSCSDFQYGESIIHEDYFTDYTRDLLEDCGYIPRDFPTWIVLDFEATADNVMQDYTSANFEGSTYYVRS